MGFEQAAGVIFRVFEGERLAPGAPAGHLPKEVWTDAFPVYEALKEAMLELGIRFVSKENLPELAEIKESLGSFLLGGGP